MNKADETIENLTKVLIEGFKDGEFSIEFAEKISEVTEEYERYKEMDKLIKEIQEKAWSTEKKLAAVYLNNEIPYVAEAITELREIKEDLIQLSNCNSGVEKDKE